ncbi:hypothetical protein MMC24_004052 [Lignoscripta atroalba]|nr:hypothetical protein [Lignoscripta atroalba]
MPPERSAPASKRKAPAFKPPQPASKPKASTSTAPPRRKSAPARPPPSYSSSEDEAVGDRAQSTALQDTVALSLTQEPPTIPPKLLTKLLHHHFDDEKTRIGKDANALVGKYMETFVREALARAAFERNETDGGKGRGGDFLEVRWTDKATVMAIHGLMNPSR